MARRKSKDTKIPLKALRDVESRLLRSLRTSMQNWGGLKFSEQVRAVLVEAIDLGIVELKS